MKDFNSKVQTLLSVVDHIDYGNKVGGVAPAQKATPEHVVDRFEWHCADPIVLDHQKEEN